MAGDAPREPAIGVWGHYHGRNLGDDLVVATIVDAIRTRRPDARIVAISAAPSDARRRHGVDAFPIDPGIRDQPSGPAAGEPPPAPADARPAPPSPPRLRATALRRLVRRTRLARVPIVFPSVGAGPIDGRLGAFFIRAAVSSARDVSVRDAQSGAVLERIGSRGGPFRVCADMAFGMPERLLADGLARRGSRPATAEARLLVGVNPMAHQDPRYWPRGDAGRYDVFVGKLAELTHRLVQQGHTVLLFSSQVSADRAVADDLVERVEALGGAPEGALRSAFGEIRDAADLLGVIARCDGVVAARYHSALLPFLLDVPVVGLAYNPKTTALFADLGAAARCLDIDSFTPDALEEALLDASGDDEPESRAALRARAAHHRADVLAQFDRLLAGLPAASGSALS